MSKNKTISEIKNQVRTGKITPDQLVKNTDLVGQAAALEVAACDGNIAFIKSVFNYSDQLDRIINSQRATRWGQNKHSQLAKHCIDNQDADLFCYLFDTQGNVNQSSSTKREHGPSRSSNKTTITPPKLMIEQAYKGSDAVFNSYRNKYDFIEKVDKSDLLATIIEAVDDKRYPELLYKVADLGANYNEIKTMLQYGKRNNLHNNVTRQASSGELSIVYSMIMSRVPPECVRAAYEYGLKLNKQLPKYANSPDTKNELIMFDLVLQYEEFDQQTWRNLLGALAGYGSPSANQFIGCVLENNVTIPDDILVDYYNEDPDGFERLWQNLQGDVKKTFAQQVPSKILSNKTIKEI